MLACLLIPLALVLVVAYYAASSDDPAAPAASGLPQGPYDTFRFEQVGVGVKRLIDDGTGYRPGDYQLVTGEIADAIAVEPDGSVLACCDWPAPIFSLDDETTLHRLGDPEPVVKWDDWKTGLDEARDLAVATDGTVWLAGDRPAALVDGEWKKARVRAAGETLGAGRDGAMWAALGTYDLRIARIKGDRIRIFREDGDLPRAVRAWSDQVTGIATTPDGRTWVGVNGRGPRRPGGLLRYDGDAWRVVRPLGRGIDASVQGLTTGPDGSLWVYLSRSRPEQDAPWRAEMYLARRDASGWTILDRSDGVPSHDAGFRHYSNEKVPMRVGADGTVWLTTFTDGGCARLVSFADGHTIDYLPDGACVHDLEVDPDGRAWVSVKHWPWAGAEGDDADLYLVDPAA